MIVISNNCGGADYYNLHNEKFNNPFMWSVVFADDMIRLINNFDKINWLQFEPILLTEEIAHANHYPYKPTVTGIKLDNVCNIYWTHYLFDANAISPVKRGPDTFYYKNYEHTLSKYITRTKRMCSMHEEPSFLIMGYDRYGWNDNMLSKLALLHTPYKTVIISPKQMASSNKNLKFIFEPKMEAKENVLPITLVKKYLQQIEKFYGRTGV
jgi:uncharacterized protein (DUF1919 family)